MVGSKIDGRATAKKVRREVAQRAAAFESRTGRRASLHVVLVGDDAASQVYVRAKERAAAKTGLDGTVHRLPDDTVQDALLALVRRLSDDDDVDGILVQLPLPKHLDSESVLDALDPAKDVDGLTTVNAGRLMDGRPGLRPCTPCGCIRLLREAECDPSGKRAIVIGRSLLVGKPIALMLLEANATVTIAHSRTVDLAERVRESDIVVAAVGRAEMVKGDWLKDGAVVLDVGINRTHEGKLVGDVAYEAALVRARAVTPVPGGVGPMTIAMLLENTLTAAERRHV